MLAGTGHRAPMLISSPAPRCSTWTSSNPRAANLDQALRLDPKLLGVYTLAGTAEKKPATSLPPNRLSANPSESTPTISTPTYISELFSRSAAPLRRPSPTSTEPCASIRPNSIARYQEAMFESTSSC